MKTDELIIKIPTAAPQETRLCLLQAAINNLKNQNMSNQPIDEADKEHNFWTLILIESLLPSVDELTNH